MFENASESSGWMENILGPNPRVSDRGWCPRICVSKRFPGLVGSAGLGHHTLRSTVGEGPSSCVLTNLLPQLILTVG